MSANALADVIVVAHFLYAAFVVAGFLAIIVGGTAGWPWVRNRVFRWAHGLAMGFVGVEAVIGMACPLTVWEAQLRQRAGTSAEDGEFIARWASKLLFYNAPPWVFSAGYIALTLLVFVLWHWVRPHPKSTVRPHPKATRP
ncbi:MAG TPA: DUF2784 domain-containing protein [bacterium]